MIFSKKSSAEGQNTEKLWTLQYILILVLGLCMSASSQMVNPNLPEYIINMGASLTLSQTIVSIVSFVAMILRPISGAANDILNRKKLMLLSTILTGICMLAYIFANNITFLVFIRVVHGLAFSLQGVSHMAFATSYIPKSRLGEGIGYLALGNSLSQMLGPSIGIFLADTFGSTYMFLAAAVTSILSAAIVLKMPYTYVKKTVTEQGRKFPKIKFSNLIAKELLFYAFFIGMFSCSNAMVSNFLKLVAKERGIENIGLFFTVNSIAMVFIRPFAGKITDKKGLAFILYPAYIISAGAMALLGAAGSLWIFLVAAVFNALGQGSGTPAVQSASIKKIGVERSGVAISTCYIGQDLMHVLGPIAGAAVVEKTNYATLFYGYAVVLLFVDLLFFLYIKFGGDKTPDKETAE